MSRVCRLLPAAHPAPFRAGVRWLEGERICVPKGSNGRASIRRSPTVSSRSWRKGDCLGCSRGIAWLAVRSEEHTSELQSLMRISYAVLCLKKKKINHIYCPYHTI